MITLVEFRPVNCEVRTWKPHDFAVCGKRSDGTVKQCSPRQITPILGVVKRCACMVTAVNHVLLPPAHNRGTVTGRKRTDGQRMLSKERLGVRAFNDNVTCRIYDIALIQRNTNIFWNIA